MNSIKLKQTGTINSNMCNKLSIHGVRSCEVLECRQDRNKVKDGKLVTLLKMSFKYDDTTAVEFLDSNVLMQKLLKKGDELIYNLSIDIIGDRVTAGRCYPMSKGVAYLTK